MCSHNCYKTCPYAHSSKNSNLSEQVSEGDNATSLLLKICVFVSWIFAVGCINLVSMVSLNRSLENVATLMQTPLSAITVIMMYLPCQHQTVKSRVSINSSFRYLDNRNRKVSMSSFTWNRNGLDVHIYIYLFTTETFLLSQKFTWDIHEKIYTSGFWIYPIWVFIINKMCFLCHYWYHLFWCECLRDKIITNSTQLHQWK